MGEKEDQILKYLNLGFESERYFPLSDKNDPKKQEWFDPFSPKILAMQKPFNDNATEGRLLSISPRETMRDDIPILLGREECFEFLSSPPHGKSRFENNPDNLCLPYPLLSSRIY